jgi:hypothetical protein
MKFRDLIKRVDNFGEQFKLTFHKADSFQTVCGGIISLFFFSICLLAIGWYFSEFVDTS